MPRPRLLPEKRFPTYAYLPGKQPHPVRDPRGHSYRSKPVTVAVEAALGSDVFRWGIDLFNHSYYWEAHQAWEPLWHAAKHSTQHRQFFKGLILLAAAGVKIREEKWVAAARHGARAAALFRQVQRGRATSLRPRSECRLPCSQNMPKRPQLPRLFCGSRCVDSLRPLSISYSHQDPRVSERQPSEASEVSFYGIRPPAFSRRRRRSWSRPRSPSHHDVLCYFHLLAPQG
ncbi:DUF309 domain-containing protein [Allomesorhizobium alhagi]|uniref:DUF309 domain-containing protein n=1 Tax=Allomesorhizobium alhagi TaxID=475067 RepID=UPI001FCB35E9|nr:DUF309 domain-containing protein [Mesorhizobium alhagi]